ncbi:DNA-(apurinic or apyrimidinic site) endonuclease 2 [Protopterus annectens]|uniref:DNA-(apurinic or apyrimidinic site) endonuclease 2 n=1 Tax=Protopterus annectens TaxID=7888 RepID=UPI001CFA01CA|nr:DNA-(apurinic or apyrimidinic site) endonuclease 2 [Protopterus annectens]
MQYGGLLKIVYVIERMKILSWNINGIRATKNSLKQLLDSLVADVICLQETKVTRDLLDEPTAIVDGYNSYFSFSRGRSGYSGVATFCKDGATPFAAEGGLSGFFTNHSGAVGCYGNMDEFSEEELQTLDSEGRAVITQHQILTSDEKEEKLTIINVYCPRADPEKPERGVYKLQFYQLLQARAEAILQSGSHVIILGDVNTSHRPIDHCEPDKLEFFDENPGRVWLNSFLWQHPEQLTTESDTDVCQNPDVEQDLSTGHTEKKRLFVDTFRHFHPDQKNAFTCWSTATGARQTNYGTRIDYIFADPCLVEKAFIDSVLMPEVEGSDHCPVKASLNCRWLASPKCPAFCTKYMPEFAGRQQKLSQFVVKIDKNKVSSHNVDILPGSQDSSEITENVVPVAKPKPSQSTQKRAGTNQGGRNNKKMKAEQPRHGTLFSFFKPNNIQKKSSKAEEVDRIQKLSPDDQDAGSITQNTDVTDNRLNLETTPCNLEKMGEAQNKPQAAFWKSVLKGLPPPPNCHNHKEPCVLRTVKKPGPNCGRQFYVCARPEGHSSNPDARCNTFIWVAKIK